MHEPNFVLLYVADPVVSAEFYSTLLGHRAVEASPTFAMFELDSGTMLGLWKRSTVLPRPEGAPGSSEIAVALASDAEVDRLHADWTAEGVAIAQAPTAMDFGYTFVALDPDGHRVRAFAPH